MRGGRLNWLVTLGLLLLCSSTAIYGQAPKKSVDLALEMAKLAREFDGALGVYAKELNGGKEFAYHADDLFATASLFKLPVMVELFRRVEAGEVSFAKPPQASRDRYLQAWHRCDQVAEGPAGIHAAGLLSVDDHLQR